MANQMPFLDQSVGQMAGALAGPTQGGLGIASRGRVYQLLQVSAQSLIGLRKRLPSATAPSNPSGLGRSLTNAWRRGCQGGKSGSNGCLRQTRCLSNEGDPTPAKSPCFTGSPESMESFIHERSESGILLLKHSESGCSCHIVILSPSRYFTRLF